MIKNDSYVIVTAAYNEGEFIANTIASVAAQELRPAKWIIVSDGSTDDTEGIVRKHASTNRFIKLYRMTEVHQRNFAAQSNAINAGVSQFEGENYAFIGNIDADISFGPSYFKLLLGKFQQNPKLGLGGGAIYDKCADGVFKYRKGNRETSVAHAVQLFRRECFESVGGAYPSLPYGGPDTYVETQARMKGWQVASFADLPVFHHRPSGSAGGLLRSCFRQGRMDFSLGMWPVFEIVKLLSRIGSKPYIAGSMARLAGFIYSYYRREQRGVPEEFMAYLRQQQKHKLSGFFRSKVNQ